MAKAKNKKNKKNNKKEEQRQQQELEQQLIVDQEEVSKLQIPLMIALTVICFIIFLLTLNPHMGPGDSGTIISMSYIFGINHPPGYPLYTMLGKLFSYLPFGSVGFRVNFMNAVMTITAALFFFKAFVHVTKNVWASFLGAALFCFAPGVWHYAVTAEVFPLNNMLIAMLFYYLVLFVQTKEKKYAYLGTLMFGLGVSNHHTIVFFGFPFAGLVLYEGKDELLNPYEIVKICLIFFVGLLPYLFLVYTPYVDHIESWGNTKTYDGFMTHLFRKEYGTFSLRSDLKQGGFIQGLTYYFKQLPFELIFVGPILAFWGIFKTWQKGLKYNGITFITIFAYTLYVIAFHYMSQFDVSNPYYYGIVYRFWAMPLLILCFWVALGAKEFMDAKFVKKDMAIGLIIALILGQIAFNYKKMDQSDNDIYYRFAKNVLESMPQNAVMLIKGDIFINSLIYTQFAGEIRPDVKILNIGRMKGTWYGPKVTATYPEIKFPRSLMVPIGKTPEEVRRPDGYTIEEFIRLNMGKFPIYTNLHFIAFGNNGNNEFDLWPWGLVYEVRPRGELKKDYTNYIRQSAEILKQFEVPDPKTIVPKSHEEIVANYYRNGLEVMAMQFANIGGRNKWPAKIVVEAINIMSYQINTYKNLFPSNFKSLGILYSMLPGDDAKKRKLAAWKQYIMLNPPQDKAYFAIRKQLQDAGAL